MLGVLGLKKGLDGAVRGVVDGMMFFGSQVVMQNAVLCQGKKFRPSGSRENLWLDSDTQVFPELKTE